MPQTHTPATGASPPTLEQVRSIAERAIAERIGKPFPDGVLDVRQDAGDDATLIVQVNSGGNAIAAESALARAGYDVVPISPPDDVSYGVVIGVRVADPLASLSPEVRALAAEGLRQHGLTEGAAALDSAASRPDRSAHPLFAEVLAAREKAHAKHGDNSIERVPAGDSRWLPILGEEFGEVCSTQTYDKDAAELRAELIDTLAVASAWVDAIDRAAISS